MKAVAEAAGLRLCIGAGGISEGAKSYRDTHGSGAGALREGIRIARALGAPVINCRIGSIADRFSAVWKKSRNSLASIRLTVVIRSLLAVFFALADQFRVPGTTGAMGGQGGGVGGVGAPGRGANGVP